MCCDSNPTVRQPGGVAAVIVTYNRCEMLLRCIQSLTAQQGATCDILVVDNASTDDTQKEVQALALPGLHYRNTGANLGGAGGFQFGMRWAVEAGYGRVWIMDDDALPEPDALEKLLAAEKITAGNYGFLSSVVLWTDGHECRMNRQKICKRFYEHVEWLQNGLIQIEQATFVSLFFSAETIRAVGLPIGAYFIWGDDIEYTRRIAVRRKMPCYLVGQSRVVHAMQANSGGNIAEDVPERIDRYRLAYRNECCTYRQEGLRGSCYYFARCVRDIGKVLRHAPNHRMRRVAVIISGAARGCMFHPKIEYATAIKPEKTAVLLEKKSGNNAFGKAEQR